MIFGSKSSPCSALFVKNKNAEAFKDTYPESVKGFINSTHKDDYLESVDTDEEAKKRIKEVEYIYSCAGFGMHEWVSNCKEIGSGANVIDMQALGLEKSLGLQWDTESDCLNFAVRMDKNVKISDKIREGPTKHKVLRTVMSVFDPLGLLNPFTIQATILLQNIWRRGTGWDEPIDKIDESEWIAWLNDFLLVKNCQVSCRLFQFDFDPASLELHTFWGASKTA